MFQTPDEAKLDYNRIQRGGDIPHYGLRMSAPDRAKGRKQTICTFIKGCGGMKHGSRDQERFCVLSSWKLEPAEFPGRILTSHCTMISTLLLDVILIELKHTFAREKRQDTSEDSKYSHLITAPMGGKVAHSGGGNGNAEEN